MLWDNSKMSELIGNDIFWNIQWGKKENIRNFWWSILIEYLSINDRFMIGRIKYMLAQVSDIGLLGYIDKVLVLDNFQNFLNLFQAPTIG